MMMGNGVYGQRLGELFKLSRAPALVTRSLPHAHIAATDCRGDRHGEGPTNPIPPENAYLVGLHLHDGARRNLWLDGKLVAAPPLAAGSLTILDLRSNPTLEAQSAFHTVCFYLTQDALDVIARDADAPVAGGLQHQPGVGMADPIANKLSRLLLPAFDHAHEANPLFVDSVVGAVGVHIAQTYGALKVRPRAARGGLAPWQERRAKELLSSNLGGDLTIAMIAKACGLSSSQFSRCFRQTTGLAPHQWLLHRRVEVAKDLLPKSGVSLSEIGLACGFADQSHFTRVFTRIVGVSPGAWRRAFCPGSQTRGWRIVAGESRPASARASQA